MLHATLGAHVDRGRRDQHQVDDRPPARRRRARSSRSPPCWRCTTAWSPPTINLDNLDPQVELDIATKARDLPDGDIAALNNSFGFGGPNVAVAFGSV